jgi:hypothetical protein
MDSVNIDFETLEEFLIYSELKIYKIYKMHTNINMNQFIKILNLSSFYKLKPTKSNSNLNSQCSICYEYLQPNVYLRKLNCNHEFHKKCIDKWLYTQFKDHKDEFTCPLCRHNINNNINNT